MVWDLMPCRSWKLSVCLCACVQYTSSFLWYYTILWVTAPGRRIYSLIQLRWVKCHLHSKPATHTQTYTHKVLFSCTISRFLHVYSTTTSIILSLTWDIIKVLNITDLIGDSNPNPSYSEAICWKANVFPKVNIWQKNNGSLSVSVNHLFIQMVWCVHCVLRYFHDHNFYVSKLV